MSTVVAGFEETLQEARELNDHLRAWLARLRRTRGRIILDTKRPPRISHADGRRVHVPGSGYLPNSSFGDALPGSSQGGDD